MGNIASYFFGERCVCCGMRHKEGTDLCEHCRGPTLHGDLVSYCSCGNFTPRPAYVPILFDDDDYKIAYIFDFPNDDDYTSLDIKM